jgi:quinol monooxygenase YgiN|tara:strand:- start:1166 stop:1558 length:393 start_codon:yes stop_codon:yes gene_type:complete
MVPLDRRTVLASAAAATSLAACGIQFGKETSSMYGLIGKFTATDGNRDALIRILLDGVSGMPGCLSYVVASDPADANVIWITEVWDSQESHAASLSMPSVQEAIGKGRPLIAGMERIAETRPEGGHGLDS